MNAKELELREAYERECDLISQKCQAIEDSTDDYWTIQNAIKENNEALAIAYKSYMKARKALLKELERVSA